MSDIIKAEIKRLVELVNEQTQHILEYPDGIPLIELDLVKESLRRLYQHVNYLSSTFDIPNPIVNPVEEEPLPEAEPSVQDESDDTDMQAEALMAEAEKQFEEKEEPQEEAPVSVEATLADLLQEVDEAAAAIAKEEEVVEEEAAPVEEVIPEQKEEEIVEEPVEEVVSEEIPEEVPVVEESAPVKEVVAEAKPEPKVQKEEPKEEMLLVDQIGKTTISSLKSAIGINDKFQFINELFDGSMPKYNAFIKKIDELENKSDAQSEVDNMKTLQSWQEDNNAFVMLQDYIDRRF